LAFNKQQCPKVKGNAKVLWSHFQMIHLRF